MEEKSSNIEKKHKGMFFELDYGKDIKLDLKDKKILSILGENCRTNITTIGKIAHMSKDSVRYRIKNLINKDIYRNNITILNQFILGFPAYIILIKIKSMTPKKHEEILGFLEKHTFIIWIGETQGAYDYHIDITAKNIAHFDKLLKEIKAKFSNDLKELKILHITKMQIANLLPGEFQKEIGIEFPKNKMDSSFSALLKNPYASIEEEKIKLNMKEILILKELSNNANLSLQQLSEKTKIKSDTIKNTIKNLINKNIILAFRGSINVSFLKYHGYIAYFNLLPNIKEEKIKLFEEYIKNYIQISFLVKAAGSPYDMVAYVFAKNPLEFNKFINDIKNEFSDIIEDYDIDLILKDYKFTFFPKGLLSPIKEAIVKIGARF